MNQDTPVNCPQCQKPLEQSWAVCPHCGLRIKPAESLLARAIFWLLILFVFVRIEISLMASDESLAWWVLCLVGIPLAYAFGKAVIFRLMGRPLTFSQIGIASIRAAFYTFMIAVVAPVVIGVTLILCFFVICLSSGVFNGVPH